MLGALRYGGAKRPFWTVRSAERALMGLAGGEGGEDSANASTAFLAAKNALPDALTGFLYPLICQQHDQSAAFVVGLVEAAA